MVLTMAAVAAHKSMTIDKLEVQVETRIKEEIGHQQKTTFATAIDLGAGLTERERKILFNSARHCEVHKLLRGSIEFREGFSGDLRCDGTASTS
jgi:uncharacterized OsmC-like protein